MPATGRTAPITPRPQGGAFGQWRRFDAGRQALMQAALERIAGSEGLSPDVYEIATRALGRA